MKQESGLLAKVLKRVHYPLAFRGISIYLRTPRLLGATRAEPVCCRGEFDGHREIPSCMCKAGSAHPQPDANGKGFWQDRIARIAFDDPIHCVSFHSPYLPAL
ncbi:hypothetical protein PPGU19_098000 (plasmid) [Paraburkholderia sp. PGU19]|uniref:hypothetical protein n=1 Tax=Paraburkholderia sp. PGU19 TaxID=2735434 RepID=UPI0015DB9F0B|nr:hypothetical protein [Paraburkholderia sp. PGU19]BCG05232.1 hypothetical protein PPGU19_098000 [Paraburkholderia sp. PGU19]